MLKCRCIGQLETIERHLSGILDVILKTLFDKNWGGYCLFV